MPSPAVVRRRIVPSMVLDCIWDGWGGGQPVRLGVMVLLPCCTGCRMDSFCSPSTIPQLKHLVTGRFMNLTHILFAVKEDQWWRVFQEHLCLHSESFICLRLEGSGDTLPGQTLVCISYTDVCMPIYPYQLWSFQQLFTAQSMVSKPQQQTGR